MTQTSPYGPRSRSGITTTASTTGTTRSPVVVPIAPVRGWALADGPRRFAAFAALPLAALMSALSLGDGTGATSAVQVLWLVVGPAAFYSLARVLRPEPRDPERTPRHLLAGAGTALSVPVLAVLALGGDGSTVGEDVVMGLGSLAFVLGVTTASWGVVSLAVRWFTRGSGVPASTGSLGR